MQSVFGLMDSGEVLYPSPPFSFSVLLPRIVCADLQPQHEIGVSKCRNAQHLAAFCECI